MIGRTISHYRILEKLGEGGMGVVYKVEDTKLDRTAALKFLTPQAIGGEDDKARFVHEAKAAAAVSHPNICHVYEIDESEGHTFIAMECIEGESLDKRIETGPLKPDEAVGLAVQIAEGLQKAHEKGIVHRDIKPANIMVTPERQAKIMDFGLAKSARRTMLTQKGTTVGTVAYMSPEQARGEAVDSRADIWSLGAVLHEMVTGQRAFHGDYEQAVIYSILNQAPEPITSLRSGVPMELERIVGKAMRKEPSDRYQHIEDLLTDLRLLLKSGQLESSKPAVKRAPRDRKRVYLPVGAAIIIGLVAFAYFTIRSGSIGGGEGADLGAAGTGAAVPVAIEASVAVLPLENLSGDPEQEYFADGMTEALITALAQVGGLRVISRTSAMHYKARQKPLPQIARELNVAAIVEGSVLAVGDRVRITAQLIDAARDQHLWARDYERDLSDVLALQGEVARAIAEEITGRLSPGKKAHPSRTRAVDPEAYRLYLKGRYQWNKRTKDSISKSIDYLQSAIDKDPGYALAYAGLADAYIVSGDWAYVEPGEAYPKGKELAERALGIDPTLAEAQAALAVATHTHDWNREEAERLFRSAIELNPNYATGHQWYAELLASLGRFDEALSEMEKAQDLDPLSLIIDSIHGAVLYDARRYDEAIEQCNKALEMDPDYIGAHEILYYVFLQKGMVEEAVAHNQARLRLRGWPVEEVEALGHAYETGGTQAWWRKQLEIVTEHSRREYFSPVQLVEIYTFLGEKDLAFEWLDRALEERSSRLIDLRVDPWFDPLRSDPRFNDALRRMGFEE